MAIFKAMCTDSIKDALKGIFNIYCGLGFVVLRIGYMHT